jgi:hypothetical protein
VSTSAESAGLLLKLFELRRDPVMRVARDWFVRDFNPESYDDVIAALGGEHNAHFRMVAGYWDMACSFVTHGAIDWQMFIDACPEAIPAFAKVEPYLAELRSRVGPDYFGRHWEAVMVRIPGGAELFRHFREGLLAASRSSGPA